MISAVGLLICEEVKHVFEAAAFHPVDFSVRAFGAGDRSKVLVLDIKYLCPESPCGTKLIFVVFPVVAFRAVILRVFHGNGF